ncbi:MAG: hypothetical protein EZS28_007539 [Streblomastix strix]|uniref:Uncharacterized protein n=1 Tax=Streblomastix strix TaxID=222440 RepID=A0A5J4WRC2_9EUKA|nr:MAG: hypothetical protein EZS28_007539 [Streblomastix strix]
MTRKYFLISQVHEILNQLDVQYDPKSTKPVLEQLLLQTIEAQGYNKQKGSVAKIRDFVCNYVVSEGNNIIATNNEQNIDTAIKTTNDTDNDETNEQNNDQEELGLLQLKRIKAKQELELAAEKLNRINKQIELRQQVTKLWEQSTRLNNAKDQLNEIKAFDLVKKSIRNLQLIKQAKKQLQELKDKQVQ